MNTSSSKIKNFLYVPIAMSRIDWLVDVVIALGAFGFGVVQLTLSANLFVPDPFTRMILGIHEIAPTPFEIVATAIICAPLVFRRRLPWPCFIFTLFFWILFEFGFDFDISSLSMAPVLISLFTIAYEREDVQTLVAGAMALAAIMFTQFFSHSNSLSSLLLFQNSCMVLACAFAGNALYARQGRMAAIEAHARELEYANEVEASKRVEEERVRIARELHDITAHSLSAIGIQAAAAERLIGRDDAEAISSVKQIRSISKDALSDMRAIVGVLRGTSATETTPIMGTDDIEVLSDYLKGFDIALEIDASKYDKKSVPSHVDVALFKIAREAVTNIARHSEATHAKIVLEEDDGASASGVGGVGDASGVGGASASAGAQAGGSDFGASNGSANAQGKREVRLIISDDGKGISGEEISTGGHGLSGMRERAQVLGGSMKVINNKNDFEVARPNTGFSDAGTTLEIRIPIRD